MPTSQTTTADQRPSLHELAGLLLEQLDTLEAEPDASPAEARRIMAEISQRLPMAGANPEPWR
ncbi:hypothetical protein CPCC7001_386 [Cyanobium sp. PCC 7001]|uniref:hypothetical protein n=1 Tax=Cyanobium sp. PCC 7001 TaxID=180281 RepID=UPI0001804B2E|nr:hypothetical protein [Cyanobium sp. PCC 7001]EDY37507.1 hypothetical protein CPCC7001_386 [Cyanobium sp. PCC 7001]